MPCTTPTASGTRARRHHTDITYGLRVTVPEVLRGYSDPPGYVGAIDLPRYDDLDLAAEYARRSTAPGTREEADLPGQRLREAA